MFDFLTLTRSGAQCQSQCCRATRPQERERALQPVRIGNVYAACGRISNDRWALAGLLRARGAW
jgi:hypothetical protein